MEKALKRMKITEEKLDLKIFAFLFPIVTLLFGTGLGLMLSNHETFFNTLDRPISILSLGIITIAFIGSYWYYAKLFNKLLPKT
tara:strand:+ start:81 stop:332 length:252 start_codon:yes stop_codon:yes gene_type:complete